MRALVHSMSRTAGLACMAALATISEPVAAADGPAQLEAGRRLFMQAAVPACALCHTLKDAGAEGAVGPVLDDLKPDAARVAAALRNGLGQMPSYAGRLSDQEIDALARYVAKASGGQR